MVSIGVLHVVDGSRSIVLPAAGIPPRGLDTRDPVQPWLGVIVAAVGLITVLFGQRRLASVHQTAVVDEGPTDRSEE
jgi:hypothetical protein